jgi:hypothetical protein
MVPQEPLLCRQLFCFTAITLTFLMQKAPFNPITPLQCETHTGPYPDPHFSVRPLFYRAEACKCYLCVVLMSTRAAMAPAE